MGRSKKHKKKGANSTERGTSILFELPKQTTAPKDHRFNFLHDWNFWFGIVGVVGTVIGILGFGLYLLDKKENGIEKNKAATSGILKTESTPWPAMIISAGGARFMPLNGVLFPAMDATRGQVDAGVAEYALAFAERNAVFIENNGINHWQAERRPFQPENRWFWSSLRVFEGCPAWQNDSTTW